MATEEEFRESLAVEGLRQKLLATELKLKRIKTQYELHLETKNSADVTRKLALEALHIRHDATDYEMYAAMCRMNRQYQWALGVLGDFRNLIKKHGQQP